LFTYELFIEKTKGRLALIHATFYGEKKTMQPLECDIYLVDTAHSSNLDG
jgi:hypothetical protein